MNEAAQASQAAWRRFAQRLLPLAEAAGGELPMPRLLRLALFQVSVGMAAVLLTGTLNRVMIVELAVPATLVALMVSLPLLAAPFRALIGYRSDRYRSFLGWRRVPFIWFGSLLQFGGFAIMPFALIILSGDTHGSIAVGQWAAAAAFALVGIGMHTTQTAGLALASDLATDKQRPYVVALLFVMLLLGMLLAALVFGGLLQSFSQVRLIQVIQSAAVLTLVLNLVALWRQEPRRPNRHEPAARRGDFRAAWRALVAKPGSRRVLMAVALGTAGFTMQDILLEPFGADVLGLAVGETTRLTALTAAGTLIAFLLAGSWLGRGIDAHRLAAYGALIGIGAFALLSVVAAMGSSAAFHAAAFVVGFGAGFFAVGTLIAAMQLADSESNGLVLGAWGAVQATAAGIAMAVAGALRDGIDALANAGYLGVTLNSPATGYSVVYQIEIVFLFVTLAVIGPLARHSAPPMATDTGLGLSEFPTGN
ncbi:MAG: BCD family MFS transporter [Pseudomonadota bacterium]